LGGSLLNSTTVLFDTTFAWEFKRAARCLLCIFPEWKGLADIARAINYFQDIPNIYKRYALFDNLATLKINEIITEVESSYEKSSIYKYCHMLYVRDDAFQCDLCKIKLVSCLNHFCVGNIEQF